MSRVFVQGELFNHSGLESLAHGCNCAGAMGGGLAVELAVVEELRLQEAA